MRTILTRYLFGRFGWLLAREEYDIDILQEKRSGK